jgi:hypothetical protein
MNDSVGVRAPGGTTGADCEDPLDIWSTIWPGASEDCKGSGLLSGYETLAGTSMATPFVSGLAAILSGKGLSNGQILNCLAKTSSNRGRFDPVMGYGVVDADAATKQCSKATTPHRFSPGGAGPLKISVTRQRISRKRLAHKRKLRVTVKANRKVTVRLRAIARAKKGAKARTISRKRVTLRTAGKRTVRMKLSRKAARFLRKHHHAKFKVRWRGGGRSGTARAR